MLVLFASKDPSPLYKSSKTKNYLKHENLETHFLLSALEMPIKSFTCYQAEIEYLKRPKSPLIFRFWNYSYFNIQMCSYLMLELKSFVSLKNECFLFRTRVHFNILKGEVKFSKILRGLLRGEDFFFWWGR